MRVFHHLLVVVGIFLPQVARGQPLGQAALLERRLASLLSAETDVNADNIVVLVEGKTVYLQGEVPTDGDRRRAIRLVQKEVPLYQVVDMMQVNIFASALPFPSEDKKQEVILYSSFTI